VILAVDPGPVLSAWLELRDGLPAAFAHEPNAAVLERVRVSEATTLAVEMVASYGMAVGADVFSTCVWAGRLIQAWLDAGRDESSVTYVYRKAVKLHVCGSSRAKDPNVRQALIDRFGPGKDAAVGRKKTPGPLYGVSGDVWAALAVAVTAADELAGQLALL
jgi:hypothetical protein